MRHRRHYTLEEARALRGFVADRVRLARSGLDVLARPESRAALGEIDAKDGGSWPGRTVARAVLDVQRAVGELQASDIVVRRARDRLVARARRGLRRAAPPVMTARSARAQ
jgi:hypothetical protein